MHGFWLYPIYEYFSANFQHCSSKALKQISQQSSQLCAFPLLTWNCCKPKVCKLLELSKSYLPQLAALLNVPLFRGEVVCWNIFLGSFLCFLSRDRSGGQGSLMSKSAATRTGTDATLRCHSTQTFKNKVPILLWICCHFRFCIITGFTCSLFVQDDFMFTDLTYVHFFAFLLL